MTHYEAVGATLEEAVRQPHDQIPLRQGRDFAVSKGVTWAMQTVGSFRPGSFTQSWKGTRMRSSGPTSKSRRVDPRSTAASA